MFRAGAVQPIVYITIALILFVSGVYRVFLALDVFPEILSSCVFTPLAYRPELQTGSLIFWLGPICHVFLHVDLLHLISNILFLIIFATPIVSRISVVRSLFFMVATSTLSVSIYLLPTPPPYIFVIGASGVISGFLGALLRLGLWRGNRPPPVSPFNRKVTVITLLVTWLLMNLLPFAEVVLGQNIAWQAHLSGFAAGFLLYPLFEPERQDEKH